jgi:hypothetical protein
MDRSTRPWLLDLATEQRGGAPSFEGIRYDDEQQLSLQEPDMRLIDITGGAPTKKADRETGEDQKAHW